MKYKNIVIQKAEKGNSIVILNISDNISKLRKILRKIMVKKKKKLLSKGTLIE